MPTLTDARRVLNDPIDSVAVGAGSERRVLEAVTHLARVANRRFRERQQFTGRRVRDVVFELRHRGASTDFRVTTFTRLVTDY